jgi:hypothetical protein
MHKGYKINTGGSTEAEKVTKGINENEKGKNC